MASLYDWKDHKNESESNARIGEKVMFHFFCKIALKKPIKRIIFLTSCKTKIRCDTALQL